MRRSGLLLGTVSKEKGHKQAEMAASKAMLQSSPKNTGTYTYSSQPRAVQQENYREEWVLWDLLSLGHLEMFLLLIQAT